MIVYHNHKINYCCKCNGENIISIKDNVGIIICEAETKCQSCGHRDYWLYGFFKSLKENK